MTLRRITAETVYEVCGLSETLSGDQRKRVVDNGTSIAQAHFADAAWFRAIYHGDEPVGFLMLDLAMDSGQPGVSLWRFMIAGPHQGRGYGRRAIEIVAAHLKARGTTALYVSYLPGPGSAAGFYRSLGFRPTGRIVDGETEAVLAW
ncbi:GNAT family N-acetyltransferase [Nocardia sp. ET3-3]|uniref:GNAT family N-acetyltransferase n=1 Tax=Nocardia terrae TaxID=2675851 RepID=A0A7K1UVM5_9NOCA|nr:GNAT family N-acetyltransferase [Nocardia terrae]